MVKTVNTTRARIIKIGGAVSDYDANGLVAIVIAMATVT